VNTAEEIEVVDALVTDRRHREGSAAEGVGCR
jgi:hypothetical protein